MTWEERWHPLREEWVVVAAHRQSRPWSGEVVETPPRDQVPAYDPDCHFCPGNLRISGKRNPDYADLFVFDNDHPCVGQEAPLDLPAAPGIYRNQAASGIARVVCFTPRHDLSLGELLPEQIAELLRELGRQYVDLGGRDGIDHVLTFENRGEVVGVSNPHPHCQIYGTNFVFNTIAKEREVCRRHLRDTGRVLFQEILGTEVQDGRRIVCERDSALAFVPYFARFAYETYVAPKETHASLADLSDGERRDLAWVLKDLLRRFNALWSKPFPYLMVLHQAPTDGADSSGFHFHIEFHPPLRQKNLLKYLAGPELGGGNFLSDTCAEEKAEELRRAGEP
ncbi:MAG: galactose-1-phosphate uridylyltransferase [Planctomycetota bacterium]